MRIWIQEAMHSADEPSRVDHALLERAGIEVARSPSKADFAVVFHIFEQVPYSPLPKNRVVIAYDEPPFAYHMPKYKDRASFHSWFSMVPMSGDNVFELTDDPIVFPYPPRTDRDRRRADTTLRSRGVFFRGTVYPNQKIGIEGGLHELYETRTQLVRDFLALGLPCDVSGKGWPGRNTRSSHIWPEIKLWELRNTSADFILAAENSAIPNYITEKIHDGFSSDRVVLYLGSPRIDELVPPGAFVNLNPYYSPATGRVDARAVLERLIGMTQDEYDKIIRTARAWRANDLLEERFVDARTRFTKRVLSRLA